MNNSAAFSRLKPLLVKFLRDSSIKNIIEIENVVKELDPDSVDKLQEFICIPFITRLTLQDIKENEKTAIKCIEFLTFMFKNIMLKEWKCFVDIFSILLSKISNVKDMNKTSSASEELKLSVCESLSNLVCCLSEEILNELFSFTFRPQLAHAFFVMNIMLKEEKSKALLKAILQAMGTLTYNDSYLKNKYKMTEYIASEALASCLPGLSISLSKVISGDDKQAHGVIIMAIDILGKLIILTAGDESFERGIATDKSSEIYRIAYKHGNLHNSVDKSTIVDSIPLVLKNEAWFKFVAQNLEIIIKNITVVSAHSHWKVRYYFLKFSESLIYHCNKTLNNCTATLLPLIFGLSVDSNEIVSSSAKTALFSLLEKFKNMNCSSLNELVEDNIEKLVTQLIKCKFSANDTKKLTILKSLLGYIEISSFSLNNKLMFSTTFLHRIILTFLTLLEFDVTELNLVEELPTDEDFDASRLLWPKKKFNFFENEEILNVICKICNFLGQVRNARVLIEYLLEKLSSNDLHTLQCIFVIGNVVKGFSNESDISQKYSNLISDVLEVFLSPLFFDVPLHNNTLDIHQQTPNETTLLTQNVLNKNKLQVCLLLEAIANCSECLKGDFKTHLMTVLCPVMEKAGMSNYIISQCGRLCLQRIANFCQYSSVHDLIKDNVDYITNVVMINFHACLHKPEIAFVLRIAMEHSDAEATILFRDLIFQVLDFLDYNQDKAYSLLHVLLSVAVSIKKWFPCEKNSIVKDSPKISTKHLRKAVIDYIKLKKTSEVETYTDDNTEEFAANSPFGDFGKENLPPNNDTDDDDIDEKKPEIPLHINIICEIFKRCIHLQSSENRFARMLTLEIVEVCILALRDYENELCPLVHEFWNPFLRRFTEDAFVPKAFNVLLIIANECGDFIRSRTFKEIMPKIILFLKQEYSKSLLRSFHKYRYTTNHSLQTLLLSKVGYLCTKFYINEKEFNSVVVVCVSYLKKEQPKVLQDAAAESLKSLSVIDSDAVWFYWNVAYSKDAILIPPHESLVNVSFPYCDNSLISSNSRF